jgi:hypothetical protein
MKLMKHFAIIVAAPLAAVMATPAMAQNYPLDPGDYVESSAIEILPGGGVEYANFLAGDWRKRQEFAKSQGWIKSYSVLENSFARDGEPDLLLITVFAKLPDAAESMRRQEAYRKFMAQTDSQMAAASGDRGKFRKLRGTMLMQQLLFK